MESAPKNTSDIFSSEIDDKLGIQKLHTFHAVELPTKAVWLIRESSVPGLLTITYYNAEKIKFDSQRIGYVAGEWRFGPSDREAAVEFSKNAELAFQNVLPGNSAHKLFKLLSDHGLVAHAQVRPNPIEATRTTQFTGYVNLHDEYDIYNELDTDESPSQRYSPF